jgi:hypothetical protein
VLAKVRIMPNPTKKVHKHPIGKQNPVYKKEFVEFGNAYPTTTTIIEGGKAYRDLIFLIPFFS